MPRAKRQVTEEEPVDEALVDEPQETDTLTGEIGEADEDPFLVQLAKELGYKEPEEWVGRQGQERQGTRLSVRDFLKDTPKVIATLKESSERSARAAAEAIEDEKRRVREEASKVIRESDDPEERSKAAERLAQNAGTPPQTTAWIAKNPWWNTDPVAQRVAATAMQRGWAAGLGIEDQILAGEEAAKRQFPQYFQPSVSEQRLSDVRRSAPMPPQVQSGTRATVTAPKEKGFAQIPRLDRDAFNNNLKRKFMSRGLTEEQAEKRYAESYWRDPPEDPSTRDAERFPMKPVSSAVWSRGRR